MPTANDTQLPFSEAIDFLADKLNLDTDTWLDGQGIVQNVAFTVAAAKGQILQDIRDSVDQAIQSGISVREFRTQFDRIADRYVDNWQLKGDRAWRSQLIYEMNIRQSYKFGRYSQMTEPSTLKSRPYWQIRHGNSSVPRPTHLALDEKVFPADKLPFWPHGFGCRCTVFSLSDRDLKRENLEVSDLQRGDEIEVVDPKTGQPIVSKLEPDPGFDWKPGKLTKERRDELLKGLDPDIRKLVLGESEAEFKLPEGSTRRRNGTNYVLQNSRWHRADKQDAPVTKSRLERASDIYELTQQFEHDMEFGSATYKDVAEKFIHDLTQMGDRDRAEKEVAGMMVEKASSTDLDATFKSAIDFCQLVDKPTMIKSFQFGDDRARADLENGIVHLVDGRSPVSRKITQFHEMAHHCEYQDKSAGLDAENWVKGRATGEITPLSQLTGNNGYRSEEAAYPDNFIDHYVGKLYGRGITEVHSMGLQAFADPDKLVDLYKKDPEHFRLMMRFIRK
jgi:hypothetical protein